MKQIFGGYVVGAWSIVVGASWEIRGDSGVAKEESFFCQHRRPVVSKVWERYTEVYLFGSGVSAYNEFEAGFL